MSNPLHIQTADSGTFDSDTFKVDGHEIATEDNARWQRHQLITRVALFILCFGGTALAMITLAP